MNYKEFLESKRARMDSLEIGKDQIAIYGLVHPVTKELKYIGKSVRVKGRYKDHLNDTSKTHKTNWIKSLLTQGLKPKLVILQRLNPTDNWQEEETEWIRSAKSYGWKLVNSTDGGDGVVNICPESKAKMLATWTGRKHKPETLLKLSKASKGRVKSEASKSFMSSLMKGRKITWNQKLKAAIRKFSDADLLTIQAELKAGARVTDLAKKYGVHRTTISKVKSGTYLNQ